MNAHQHIENLGLQAHKKGEETVAKRRSKNASVNTPTYDMLAEKKKQHIQLARTLEKLIGEFAHREKRLQSQAKELESRSGKLYVSARATKGTDPSGSAELYDEWSRTQAQSVYVTKSIVIGHKERLRLEGLLSEHRSIIKAIDERLAMVERIERKTML